MGNTVADVINDFEPYYYGIREYIMNMSSSTVLILLIVGYLFIHFNKVMSKPYEHEPPKRDPKEVERERLYNINLEWRKEMGLK